MCCKPRKGHLQSQKSPHETNKVQAQPILDAQKNLPQ